LQGGDAAEGGEGVAHTYFLCNLALIPDLKSFLPEKHKVEQD